MAYLALYILGIVSIWWISRVGIWDALKAILSVVIPSVLIILLNAYLGRLLFRNPLFGFISALPIAVFVYKSSAPLVDVVNSWIDRQKNDFQEVKGDVVDAEVISKEEV